MDPDEKTKKNVKKEVTLKTSPIEEGFEALEKLFTDDLGINPCNPRMEKFMKAMRIIVKKMGEMEMAARGHSEEIYETKQNMNKSK